MSRREMRRIDSQHKGFSTMKRHVLLFALVAVTAPSARADFLIRIGDKDGFGYNNAPGFRAANGGLANRDGAGVLENGDFLPDINQNGSTKNNSNDEFDFRSTAEVANTSFQAGFGVSNTAGTVGSSFTDISLTRSYDARSAAGRVLIGGDPINGLIRGTGGLFPAPPSSTLPNQPGFVFHFDVDRGVLDPSAPIFFNLVFGDYDVVPAEVQITDIDGDSRIIPLMRQGRGDDGLIQAATANLRFNEVFTDAGSVFSGFLKVDFIAPNEPYTAFDYVELSPTALVPEPASLSILGAGALCLLCYTRSRRARAGRGRRKLSTPVRA